MADSAPTDDQLIHDQQPVRGTLFVVSAPSGAGKTSLVRELVAADPHVQVSVSHTTRPSRPGEQDGVNYHFVNVAAFDALLAAGGFLEHARVFDHWYGTSVAAVESSLSAGKDVVLEIDWQGARQIRERLNCTSIFIVPPSREALLARLQQRGQDHDAVIARRIAEATQEMTHYAEFDYLIVNEEFAVARAELLAIVTAERLRSYRQSDRHGALLARLLAG